MTGEKQQILLIEDDASIARTITIQLQLVGFTVRHFSRGEEALQADALKNCQAIILDWMLPDAEGPEIIPLIRQSTTAPLLMLTARSEIVDKLSGFEAGADDYLTKPFEMMELIARLKALIRRRDIDQGKEKPQTAEMLRCGNISLDVSTRRVMAGNELVTLTPTEFKLLEIFIAQPEKVFSRDELIEQVLGYEYEGYGRTLDSHIARLRGKIEADPRNPRYIQTVFGIGYKLVIPDESEEK